MSKDLANVCKYLTHGVYVIAVKNKEREHAFTAAWVMQVSFDPPLLAFSINPQHYSYQILKDGGQCSINVLAKAQLPIAAHFGDSNIRNKMTGYSWQAAPSGVSVLTEALAYFDCVVSHSTPAGDHEIVICRVLDAGILNAGVPMHYSDTDNMDGSDELYA
ncbi:flavin reductase family protein [Methylomonas montana]|uniref:flavin reductase family protein n=1 Tax=Methylomonas montana TaxID=3058963 RepID=UPI0026582D3D|nr:flavin reductase family protein [Methylomonas montana]WKJ89630.1 flavin reductase family protein [Methylomonas montana]